MKKIFNKIFAAVLVAGLSVAFAACSSDPTPYQLT